MIDIKFLELHFGFVYNDISEHQNLRVIEAAALFPVLPRCHIRNLRVPPMGTVRNSAGLSAFLYKFIPAFPAADGYPASALRYPDFLFAVRASVDMVILTLSQFPFLFDEKAPDLHLLLQELLVLGRTFADISGKHTIIGKNHYDGSQYVENPSAKKRNDKTGKGNSK